MLYLKTHHIALLRDWRISRHLLQTSFVDHTCYDHVFKYNAGLNGEALILLLKAGIILSNITPSFK